MARLDAEFSITPERVDHMFMSCHVTSTTLYHFFNSRVVNMWEAAVVGGFGVIGLSGSNPFKRLL